MKRRWPAIPVFILLVCIDQITKYVAKLFLQGNEPVSLIKDVLEFQYLEGGNTGAAFGMFQGKTFLLGCVSLLVFIVITGVFLKLSKEKDNKWLCWCLVVMAAGAIGNGIDRFVHHYVIDFIYFKLIDFPIFNVADCYVTIAAIVLFLLVLLQKEDKPETTEETHDTEH